MSAELMSDPVTGSFLSFLLSNHAPIGALVDRVKTRIVELDGKAIDVIDIASGIRNDIRAIEADRDGDRTLGLDDYESVLLALAEHRDGLRDSAHYLAHNAACARCALDLAESILGVSLSDAHWRWLCASYGIEPSAVAP